MQLFLLVMVLMRCTVTKISHIYMTKITAKIGSNFSVGITRRDEHGNIYNVYTQNITLNTSTSKFINYSSNISGYYNVIYNDPDELMGREIGFVSYSTIDSKEAQKKGKKCIINKMSRSRSCRINIEFKNAEYNVLVFVNSVESYEIIITSLGRVLDFNILIVSSLFVLFIVVEVVFLIWKCRRKDTEKFTKAYENESNDQADENTSVNDEYTPLVRS